MLFSLLVIAPNFGKALEYVLGSAHARPRLPTHPLCRLFVVRPSRNAKDLFIANSLCAFVLWIAMQIDLHAGGSVWLGIFVVLCTFFGAYLLIPPLQRKIFTAINAVLLFTVVCDDKPRVLVSAF
jgi:hypothetical protein